MQVLQDESHFLLQFLWHLFCLEYFEALEESKLESVMYVYYASDMRTYMHHICKSISIQIHAPEGLS